ncbi:MAG: hypothetical protein AB4352_08300 [Hormoscilla sp.]
MNNKVLIPALIGSLMPAASVSIFVRPALAETFSFTFVQGFGYQSGTYKAMVKSPRNGTRYFVWYDQAIGVYDGKEVLINIDSLNYWTHISNPANGNISRIAKVEKVQ